MLASCLAAAFMAVPLIPAVAHDEPQFDAGAPGDSKQPARVITIIMSENGGGMNFTPDRLDVKKDEQVRFVLENKGALAHEFRLASVKNNDEHAAMMQQMPDMRHREPNAVTLDSGRTGEMLWRFSQSGTFEFACLIPGHREAGMHGTVQVK
jgi:uncharacterized cupredoxin-like copper-binding protein